MVAEGTSLRAMIGGRWAVSWQSYAFAYPVSVGFIVFTEPAFSDTSEWLMGLAVSTVAYLATGGVLAIAGATVLRHRRETPAPIFVVVVVGGIAWMARSAVLKAFLVARDLPSEAALSQRLLYGFLLGATIVPITAWTLASFSHFNKERRRLVEELVREQASTQSMATYVQAVREGILERIQIAVRRSGGALLAMDDGNPPSPSEGVRVLDALSQVASRELSEDLWREARKDSRVHVTQIIRSAVFYRPFSYWMLIPIVAFGFPVLLRIWPTQTVVIVMLVLTVWALCISGIANALVVRVSARTALCVYVIAVGLLLMSGVWVVVFVNWLGSQAPDGDRLPLLASLGFGIVYTTGGLAAGTATARRETLDSLRASISDAEIQRAAIATEELRVRREIATALHGNWSGNLTAVSMRLQQAIDKGDSQAANEALYEAKRLVEIEIVRTAQRDESDLQAITNALAAAWDGLVSIRVHLNLRESLSPSTTRAVEDVIIEGINNAVRHADAQNITISVEGVPTDIEITITDDGHSAAPSPPGLGSQLFDSVAAREWSLTPQAGGGSVLSVRMRT